MACHAGRICKALGMYRQQILQQPPEPNKLKLQVRRSAPQKLGKTAL